MEEEVEETMRYGCWERKKREVEVEEEVKTNDRKKC